MHLVGIQFILHLKRKNKAWIIIKTIEFASNDKQYSKEFKDSIEQKVDESLELSPRIAEQMLLGVTNTIEEMINLERNSNPARGISDVSNETEVIDN